MSLTDPDGDHPAVAHAKTARRKQARPSELVAAALDLFVEKGFAATRAEEVATRAGVSKGTLFLYFASKEDLFKAVVRENISGLYPEWSGELDSFSGSTADLLHYCMQAWWSRIGDTKASGMSMLIMSEAQNFPEIADFYQHEVVEPGNALIRRILQRGIDRGEFRPVDMQYGVYVVLAPMMFLVMWKYSLGACMPAQTRIDPQTYIQLQIDTILRGLALPPTPDTGLKGHS